MIGSKDMPETKVIFYQEDDGTVPVLDWLNSLPPKAKAKCRLRIERLQELGYELRRPEADYLRDGIYELRIRRGHVNYRILYFFYRNQECCCCDFSRVGQRTKNTSKGNQSGDSTKTEV